MSPPQISSPPHQYPQEIQLKLYQAFIFSIPILFSIILFLLFYLFYLKRRASSERSAPHLLPRTVNGSATTTSPHDPCSKSELKTKLCRISFDDEYTETNDSLCCVCLGEFETKEELVLVEKCKHVFHESCIHLWLHTNATCPLCRASVGCHTNTYHKNVEPRLSHQQLPGYSEADHTQQMHLPRGVRISSEGSASTSGDIAC
ncbi:RING-H2 zinc finger protein RHA4a [Striga hermonthica]|uniref:RING-type E3 ubiquitin transferase n=1 Tax=Striga hermonthica TaxID=68872 RepID=A0A9N7NYY3_STRHE|nr:RING-H2 zinc finger protein RHA4a [Striga hermonthica]